jgi:hypothetical protein
MPFKGHCYTAQTRRPFKGHLLHNTEDLSKVTATQHRRDDLSKVTYYTTQTTFQRSQHHSTDETTFQRSLTTQHRRPFKGHFFHFQLVPSICCFIACIRCLHETGPKGLELCLQHVFAFDIPFFTPEWASYFKN